MLKPQHHQSMCFVIRGLWLGAALLTAGHLLNWAIGGRLSVETINLFLAKFHLDSENSVAAWFSSLLLTFVAAGWLVLAGVKYRNVGERMPWRLMLLAAVFVLLSCDETASLHELLIAPVRNGLGVGGILHLAWIIPAMGFLMVLGLVVWPLYFQVSPTLRRGAIIAGMLFVGGAIGAEMVGGKMISEGDYGSFAYILTITFEEGLEIVGLLFMLTTMSRDLDPARVTQEAKSGVTATAGVQAA